MVVNAFNPLALGRQGQADLLEFQDSRGYTETPCLDKPKQKKNPF